MKQYRTPLRYPGGKQRLAPFIREILSENELIGGHYAEPYAGGAGVAFELLFSGHVSHIHLNDSYWPIYAFWNSIILRPDEICRRIDSVPFSVEEWKRHREILNNPTEHAEIDVGFAAFYLNRCNRSGVLNGGLIGGLAQAGEWKMDARFPRSELIRRIQGIASMRGLINIRNQDAEQFILEYIPHLPDSTLVYCDPPYFVKAKRLYQNHYNDSDHARVARIIQEQLPRKWVVSYDCTPEIADYYRERRSFSYYLQYNASRAYKGREIFVFSDDLVVPLNSSLLFIDDAMQIWRAEQA